MRTFLRLHPRLTSAPLSSQLSNKSAHTFFLSISDDEEYRTLASVLTTIEQLVKARNVKGVEGEIEDATILVQRGDAADTNAPLQLYRLQSNSDAVEIRAKDILHVFFPSNSDAREDVEPAGVASVSSARAAQSAISFLPFLRTTFSTRPLSLLQKQMAELDAIHPDCSVARQEPLIDFAEVRVQAAKPWSEEARRSYALQLRQTFAKYSFLRLKFTSEQMILIRRLFDAQRKFFDLPLSKKQISAPFMKAESKHQIPWGYSAKAECLKEFYVFRQQPVNPTNEQLHFPSEPADFLEVTTAVYTLFGSICQDLMTLLLQSYNVPEEKVLKILTGSMNPPKSMYEMGCTSVIELFKYNLPADGTMSPSTAGSKEEAGDATMSSDASSSSPAMNPASPAASLRRPPLPCSIHSDASLLTLIPRCIGTPGLQLWNTAVADWQAVEAQSKEDEGIVFIGDMFARLTNDAILPTQHRVVFGRDLSFPAGPSTAMIGDARYSCPFELFLSPSLIIDCNEFLSSASDLLPIRAENSAVQSAQEALFQLSRNRVSVNQTNV